MKQQKYNSLFYVFLMIILIFSYDLIMVLVESVLSPILSKQWLDAHSLACDCICLAVQFIVYLVIYRRYFRPEPAPGTFSGISGVIKSILIGSGVSGIILLWNLFVYTFLTNWSIVQESSEFLEEAFGNIPAEQYIVALIDIGILGPIVEELLIRGLIFNCLERINPKPWFPIVFSALIFGIWHGNFIQSVYTFIMALIVGYIYYKTRNIIWVIIIHMTLNCLSTLPPSLDTTMVNAGISVVSLIMIVPTFYIMVQLRTKKEEKGYYYEES